MGCDGRSFGIHSGAVKFDEFPLALTLDPF